MGNTQLQRRLINNTNGLRNVHSFDIHHKTVSGCSLKQVATALPAALRTRP